MTTENSSKQRALIFANGILPDRAAARNIILPGDILIAANGGSKHLLALGLSPDVIIGDLDSLTEDARKRLDRSRAQFINFPAGKDEIDLELSLQYATARKYDPIIIMAALGGRLDQTIANLSILTDVNYGDHDIRLDDGIVQAIFTRKWVSLQGSPGDLVSLLPWGRVVKGVKTSGLKWPLAGENLYPHKTRGISNEMLSEIAVVQIKSGLLLVIHSRHPRD